MNKPYPYSKKSTKALYSVEDVLREGFFVGAKIMDIAILRGRVSYDVQLKIYEDKVIKAVHPDVSKHVEKPPKPAKAIDAAPYPIDWNDHKRFYYMAGVILAIAHTRKNKIRWGGDWDGNHIFGSHEDDLVHYETWHKVPQKPDFSRIGEAIKHSNENEFYYLMGWREGLKL